MTMEHKMTVRPQPTEDELQAILSLQGNKKFEEFRKYLEKRAIATALLSTTQTGEQCHWIQGRSQELSDLVAMIKNADVTYEKLRGNRK